MLSGYHTTCTGSAEEKERREREKTRQTLNEHNLCKYTANSFFFSLTQNTVLLGCKVYRTQV